MTADAKRLGVKGISLHSGSLEKFEEVLIFGLAGAFKIISLRLVGTGLPVAFPANPLTNRLAHSAASP